MKKHKYDIEAETESILLSIKRISSLLGKTPTQKEYKLHRRIEEFSLEQIFYRFGNWKNAIELAGLKPNPNQSPPHNNQIDDKDLIIEFIAVSNKLKTIPAKGIFRANSKYSWRPYISRWGSWQNAVNNITQENKINFTFDFEIDKSKETQTLRKNLGKDFPLLFEPINEYETIILFALLSKELGYKIKSVRSEFPDAILEKEGQEILAEFEFLSSNYLQHCHPLDFNGLCICWRKDIDLKNIQIISLEDYIKRK